MRNEHITSLLGQLAKDALTLVEIPALAISSTDCRQRAEQSRPLWYLMPTASCSMSPRRLYCGACDAGARSTTSLAAGNGL